MDRVEVITSVQRRRRFTPEQKRAIIEEAEQPGSSMSIVARKYGINPSQVFKWRRLMQEGALVAAGAEEQVVPLSEVKELRAEIRELQRLLGKKTMEVEILKDAIRIAREKKLISRVPLPVKDGTP
jgi:transposase